MGILTTNEIADFFGVTQSAVAQWIRESKLKADKKGRDWLISTESLIDYVQSEMETVDMKSQAEKEHLQNLLEKIKSL